jgi:hypothetical protein
MSVVDRDELDQIVDGTHDTLDGRMGDGLQVPLHQEGSKAHPTESVIVILNHALN